MSLPDLDVPLNAEALTPKERARELAVATDGALPAASLGIAIVYGLYAVAHWFLLPENARLQMSALAFATFLAGVGISVVWRRRKLAVELAPLGMGCVAWLVLINCAVHQYLLPDPRNTTNFYLLIVGSGIIVLSTPWFLSILVASWASWGIIVSGAPLSDDWVHFGFGLFSFSAAAVIIRTAYIRQLTRLHFLHRRDVLQQERLQLALADAEKASLAKSEFLAGMSHELRTPLNSVIGFGDLLAKEKAGTLNERQQTFVERIRSNSRHLLGLINQLLDLARIEAGRVILDFSHFDLCDLLEQTLADVAVQARAKNLEVSFLCPAGLKIESDREKLRQILTNLLGNGIKFTEHGEVRIIVESEGDQALRISVRDTGIGIASDNLDRVFERFEQAEGGRARRHEGSGLGLSMCVELCHLLGYQMSVTSQLGEGSTFVLELEPPAREGSE